MFLEPEEGAREHAPPRRELVEAMAADRVDDAKEAQCPHGSAILRYGCSKPAGDYRCSVAALQVDHAGCYSRLARGGI